SPRHLRLALSPYTTLFRSWRAVGQYPDGTAEEALAYYARKFDDLAVKLGTLETRAQGGGSSAADLTKQATHLLGEVTGAAAVGRSEEHTSELQSRENLVCR